MIASVQAYFPVMQKNFLDSIFKYIKWYCKDPREKWIEKEITTNLKFKEMATEPKEISRMRTKALDIIHNSEKKLEILYSM